MIRVTYDLTVVVFDGDLGMGIGEEIVSYFKDTNELDDFLVECSYANERVNVKNIEERVSVVSIWNDNKISHSEKVELIGMLLLPYHQFKGKKVCEIEKALIEMGVI